nr:hypothetical protein [Tanacetum cinerariifolium]
VTGLPQTQRRHDAIWVVVDRLTKSAQFLPIRKDYSVSRLAKIFQQEIVRLHGTPLAIVSDRDPRFASRFWKGLQKAWGTRLKFSTAFHPQTDGQSERTIQTLEDMLSLCELDKLAETFQQEIVRLHGTPSTIVSDRDPRFASRFWKGLQKAWGTRLKFSTAFHRQTDSQRPEMIEVTTEKVAVAKEQLKEARTRQKSYADKHRRSLEFQPGDRVFLKVSPAREVRRFGIKGKLSPRFIEPFKILDRVGEIRADLSYVEEPEAILDRQDRVMRKKTIPFISILWRNHPEREATWETEESIRTSYPHFLP